MPLVPWRLPCNCGMLTGSRGANSGHGQALCSAVNHIHEYEVWQLRVPAKNKARAANSERAADRGKGNEAITRFVAAGPAERMRRRILHDMGIEVWYARRKPGEAADLKPGEARAAVGKTNGGGAGAGSRGRTGNDAPGIGLGPSAPVAQPPPATVEPEQPDEPPFAVVAFGVPGALLVADASPRRQEALLARDVLRAASGDWSAAAARARFDWPQPGASGVSGPALAAFVEKQVEDTGARLLLVTDAAAERLDHWPRGTVGVPDLPSLADPEKKLTLWRRIQQLTR